MSHLSGFFVPFVHSDVHMRYLSDFWGQLPLKCFFTSTGVWSEMILLGWDLGSCRNFYTVSCGQNDQTSSFQPALVVPFRGNVDLPLEHGMLHRIALFETIQNLKRKRTPESILKKLGQTKIWPNLVQKMKKWARWFKVKFSHPLFGGHKQPSKGWPVNHSKKLQNSQAESCFSTFHTEAIVLVGNIPLLLVKTGASWSFQGKRDAWRHRFLSPWKTSMTMEMHLISRCMYLMKNGQIFHDIPCYFSGGVSCVCFFHLGARDPKIPSFGSDFWRNHAPIGLLQWMRRCWENESTRRFVVHSL